MNYQFLQNRQAAEWIRHPFKTQSHWQLVAIEFKAVQLEGTLLAELRTKHTQNLGADQFCFPPNTGIRGIQGDYFRDRPI